MGIVDHLAYTLYQQIYHIFHVGAQGKATMGIESAKTIPINYKIPPK